MTKSDNNDIGSYRSKYESIPSEVWRYYQNSLRARGNNLLLHSIEEDGVVAVFERLNSFFGGLERRFGIGAGTLLRKTGFTAQDINSDRFESSLAELRTMSWLDDLGVQGLELKELKDRRYVDILAQRDGKKLIVEVFCWPSHYEKKGAQAVRQLSPPTGPHAYQLNDEQFANEYVRVVKRSGKVDQIHAALAEHPGSYSLLVLVLNTSALVALRSKRNYCSVLNCAFSLLSLPSNCHLAIMTGMLEPDGSPSECIVPPL